MPGKLCSNSRLYYMDIYICRASYAPTRGYIIWTYTYAGQAMLQLEAILYGHIHMPGKLCSNSRLYYMDIYICRASHAPTRGYIIWTYTYAGQATLQLEAILYGHIH